MDHLKIETSLVRKIEGAGTESLQSFPVFIQPLGTIDELQLLPEQHMSYGQLPLIYCELSIGVIKQFTKENSVKYVWDADAEIHLTPETKEHNNERTDIRKLIFDPMHPEHPDDADSYNGSGICCAVIDTSADINHIDIYPNIRKTTDCTNDQNFNKGDKYHGTHVAGIVVQVAPEIDLNMYKVFDVNNRATRKNIVDAILAAVEDQVDIINGSWGEPFCQGGCPVEIAATYAVEQGIIFCGSAGNAGPDHSSLTCPAGCEAVFNIGACSCDKQISDFSSRGPSYYANIDKPDIVAPGEKISSCGPGGGHLILSGTSMAAPAAAGGCALLLSQLNNHNTLYEDISSTTVTDALKKGAEDMGYDYHTQGAGFININAAIKHTYSSRWKMIGTKLNRLYSSYWAVYSLIFCLGLGLWYFKPWADKPEFTNNAISAEITTLPDITKYTTQKLNSLDKTPSWVRHKPQNNQAGGIHNSHYPQQAHYAASEELLVTLGKVGEIIEDGNPY